VPDRLRAGAIVRLTVEHEPGCPAVEVDSAPDVVVVDAVSP